MQIKYKLIFIPSKKYSEILHHLSYQRFFLFSCQLTNPSTPVIFKSHTYDLIEDFEESIKIFF